MAESSISTAPETIRGPVLLLAGPGTGKTFQLCRRVKRIVEEGGNPDDVTVVTFTGPAATNLRQTLGDRSKPITYVTPDRTPERICTMHSLAYRIVQKSRPPKAEVRLVPPSAAELLIQDSARILAESQSVVKQVRECRTIGVCSRTESGQCKVCEQYRKILQRLGSTDYDEMMLEAARLLGADAATLEYWRARCSHLLVDEYQDINEGQYRLIRLLSSGNEAGLFVAGDDDQSIYSWRGGSAKYIRSFVTDFPTGRVWPLDHNRRTPEVVFRAAARIIDTYDPARLDKPVHSFDKPGGEKIHHHNLPSPRAEAQAVARLCRTCARRSLPWPLFRPSLRRLRAAPGPRFPAWTVS